METLESFVVSHELMAAESDALREWELSMDLNAVRERVCTSINLYNGVPVVPMALVSKESRGLLSKLQDRALERVYALHRLIVIAYVPSVLGGTAGVINVKLLNVATGESIEVARDHPVKQAATFVARWPRAVLAKADGLALLFTATDVPTRKGSLIGTFHPFWEDKLSSKMVYEKQLPTLVYNLEEQDPSHYVKNVGMLRALMASKVHLGGVGSDMVPQTISLAMPKTILQDKGSTSMVSTVEQSKEAPSGGPRKPKRPAVVASTPPIK